MLDLHFNGARSGVHVIVAHNLRRDGRDTLSSGYPQGRVAADVLENNTLDVKVGKSVAKEIANIDGMTLWGSDGIMPENQTGVGNDDGRAPDNARLAMMAATAPYRLNALRFTVEHGGTNDASKPDFANKCAQAAVRAIASSLGDRIDQEPSGPAPDPDLPETPPKGDPGGPDLHSFLFGEADGYLFDPNGPVSKLWLETGKQAGRYPRLIDVFTDGPRRHFVFADGSIILADGTKPVALLKDVTV